VGAAPFVPWIGAAGLNTRATTAKSKIARGSRLSHRKVEHKVELGNFVAGGIHVRIEGYVDAD